ncbi:hypothetical protein H2198_001533 [Neophaeococcomyces mojaviensis]|uniref:Uncharacterized protein n=1 Tax=Neophaeococcomyces mojaviensis TaxID=3383035 RepID=A0ACC3AGQ9_9EURO|nr:hypothetical protein H2198_001533 [Knufia sp. JES_112]
MELSDSPHESLPDQPGLRPNRACRNCVQIKARCVPCENQAVCQRCHRLGKECTTPAPVPRKRSRTKPSKVAELEDKVNHLTQLLDERHDNVKLPTPPTSLDQATPRTSEPIQSSTLNAQEYYPHGRVKNADSLVDVSPEISHSFVAASHEKLFELFRTTMIKHFPFIDIPQHITASTMKREKPFFYTSCVMTAAHRNPPLQYRVARDMLKYAGEHMLLSGEKNLDLLQGLLVMVVWYHVYTHNNPQIMNLLHLSKALMVDLGLNRPPGVGIFQIKMSSDVFQPKPSNESFQSKMSGDAQQMLHGQNNSTLKHTLEQRRTYLGIYHTNSKLCACFRRLEDMRWNDYLEECCQQLETAPEYPSDTYAAALVRLDRLVERYTGADGVKPGKSMPLQAYVRLFSHDIDQFIRNQPTWLRDDGMMAMQVQNAELCLYEIVLSTDCNTPAHKVEALHACLNKLIAFFGTFMELSNTILPSMPFLSWAHISHALDIMAKLSFVVVEGWDVEWVRGNHGFISMTGRLMEKLKQTYADEQTRYPENISIRFKIFAEKLQWCQQWYNTKVEAEARTNRPTSADVQDLESDQHQTDASYLPFPGEFSDMIWQDFMIDWPQVDGEINIS